MSFDPSSYTFDEPEDRKFVVFPKGEYAWRILEINELTQSSSGNPMLPIKFEFTNGDDTTTVYENFVFTESAKFKIDQFMKCCSGQMAPGRKINFTDPEVIKWLKARTGRAKLTVEPVKGKDYTRNAIEAFVYETTKVSGPSVSTPPAKQQPPSVPAEEEMSDDDIPF
jgi:hypothetical protein